MFKTVDSVLKSFHKTVSDLREIEKSESAKMSQATEKANRLHEQAGSHGREASRAASVAGKIENLLS